MVVAGEAFFPLRCQCCAALFQALKEILGIDFAMGVSFIPEIVVVVVGVITALGSELL